MTHYTAQDVINRAQEHLSRRGVVELRRLRADFQDQFSEDTGRALLRSMRLVEHPDDDDTYVTMDARQQVLAQKMQQQAPQSFNQILGQMQYGSGNANLSPQAGWTTLNNYPTPVAIPQTTPVKTPRKKAVKVKPEKVTVTMDSVIISEEKKEQIRAAISQTAHEATIFEKWGFGEVFEKGTAITLLFWGVPGTGKTLMAQAIADELKKELKIYGTAEIESSEPGGAERQIKTIFAEAKRKKDQVILLDECDSLLVSREEAGPILGAMVNTLLTELERYDGVCILTTNRLGRLDPALERRITAKIEFEFPNEEARLNIWRRMIPKKAPLHKEVNLKELAKHPLAGGNIKNAVLNAARRAAYEKKKQLEHGHFLVAVENEKKSLKAFADEYNKTAHSHMNSHTGIQRTASGSLKVQKKMDIKKAFSIGGGTGAK